MIRFFFLLSLFLFSLGVSFAGPEELPLVVDFSSLLESSYEGAFALGSYTVSPHPELPLVTQYNAIDYGGFPSTTFAFAFSSSGDTFFMSGMTGGFNGAGGFEGANAGAADSVAEFSIPSLTKNSDINDRSGYQQAEQIQPWSSVFDPENGLIESDEGGSHALYGLYYNKETGELCVVTGEDFPGYPYSADNMVCFESPSDLDQSQVNGYYQLTFEDIYPVNEEGSHVNGWITDIPVEWQSILGGKQLFGSGATGSIVSRFPFGPTLFTGDLSSLSSSGNVNLNRLMDFDDSQGRQMGAYLYGSPDFWYNYEGFNCDRSVGYNCGADLTDVNEIVPWTNDFWTILSYGVQGFIIPGTRTYVVLGTNEGVIGGAGYKPRTLGWRSDPNGPARILEDDYYNYYWLFDLNEIVSANEPWEVFPYEYGALGFMDQVETRDGNKATLQNAGFDIDSQRLAIIVTQRHGGSNPKADVFLFNFTGQIDSNSTTPVTPSLSLSSSVSSIDLGDSFDLTWSSSYLDSCIALGSWSGSKSLSGSQTITPSSTSQTTYNITCTNLTSSDSLTRTVTITINEVSTPPLTPVNSLENYFDYVCAPLPASSGPSITVSPSEASNLRSIIQGAAEGTTIYLEDGFYDLSSSSNLAFSTQGLTLRSLSGNRSAVILDSGYSSSGASEPIYIVAPDVTIADLTIQRAWYHPIKITDNADNVLIHNVKIIDGSEQFIKINPSSDGTQHPDNGVVQCSYFEMTDTGSTNVRNGCYTGGIDGHSVQGWQVRHNIFKDIYCRDGSGLAEHAVHFWSRSRDTLVENNLMIDNARGIGFGLGSEPTSAVRIYSDISGTQDHTIQHIGGLIRNNFIYSDIGSFADTGIGLERAQGAEVYHNTIFMNNSGYTAIDSRFDTTTASINNNLYFSSYGAGFSIRDSAFVTQSGNLIASASMFTDLSTYDFSLVDGSSAIDSANSSDVVLDIFGTSRPQGFGYDVGAYEVDQGSQPPTDTTAPSIILLNSLNGSQFNSDISSVDIQLSTSEPSSCIGSLNSDFSTSFSLTSSDSLVHSSTLSVSHSNSYIYYLRCEDLIGNQRVISVNFSVDVPDDNSGDDNPGSSGSSGSSGGGGGSSSSSSRSSSTSSFYVAPACVSDFEYSDWSACLNGIQSRTVIDVNSCSEDTRENRECNIDNTEIENKFLNAKEIQVEQSGKRTYYTNLEGSYNEIVYVQDKLEDNSFVLIDEETGNEYLGRLVEEDDDKFYYSLERIDKDLLEVLKEEGLLQTSFGEDVSELTDDVVNHQSFWTVIGVITFLIVFTLILGIRFYWKKHHNNQSSFNYVDRKNDVDEKK